MFLTPANNVFVQKTLNFADSVKDFPPYPRIVHTVGSPQPLQCFGADFQKGANLVTVHPPVGGFFLRFSLQSGNKFGNRIDLLR